MSECPAHDVRAFGPGQSGRWSAFIDLYRRAFDVAERENEAVVTERVGTGRYEAVGAFDPGGALAGFALRDRVAAPRYAVVTFLAVQPARRGMGLGRRLASEAGAVPGPVLVEAGAHAAPLYRRAGYRPLDLDYRVPCYDDPAAVIPMTLLVGRGSPLPDGATLRRIVTHMYRDGYGVDPDDERLTGQLRRIPDVLAEVGP